MLGVIGIHHYAIDCVIGVYPKERSKEQTIYVDLEVSWDISSCIDDNLKNTINYEVLAKICKEVARQGKYRLLEAFALDALEAIFEKFSPQKVIIKVKKPTGLPLAEYTFVCLERRRDAKD